MTATALDALLAEGSIAGAACRLGLSASAMSVLLLPGRLSTLQAGAFSDAILVDCNPRKHLALLGHQGKHLALIMKAGILHKNLA